MRPIILLMGALLVIYVVAEWIGGTLQYSFEGYIGNGIYGIANYANPGFASHASFMAVVYVLTALFGILMVWIGLTGERK